MGWIREYAKPVFGHWWASMSCAAFTIVGVYSAAFGKSGHWVVVSSFVLAFTALVIATGQAWRDEYNKLLQERAKNALPKFSVQAERAVYCASNSHLFVLCSVVNLSEKQAGLRSATLLDVMGQSGDNSADETFKTVSLYKSGANRIAVDVNESGWSVKELLGAFKVDNLLTLASPLLVQGKRETGWLAFSGVSEPKTTTFHGYGLRVIDTLGGEHDTTLFGLLVERSNVLA